MYLTPIRLSLIAIVAIALIFTTGTAATKSVLAQSASSATTTIQSPSSGQEFSAKMTGDKEVPPVSTDTTGTIRVKANSQQQTLDYDLTLTNLNGVITGAHIHMGKPGFNGPIVADLNAPGLGGAAAASSSSSGGGTAMTSNSVSGTIRSTDLKGPLEGKQITDLVKLIEEGRAYTNVHTEQNPDGEIRGQLAASSSSSDITSTDNTGSASASTSQSPSASASATAP